MARQTRAQRRARRAEQAESARRTEQGDATARRAEPADVAPRQRARQAEVAATAETARADGAQSRVQRAGGKRFVAESWGELKKVEWPRQPQVIQGTAVVLIACLIVGIYLYANDLVWKRVIQNVFLGQ